MPDVRDKLQEIADQLRTIEPLPWANIEVLAVRAKTLVRTAFPEHFDELTRLSKTPQWAFLGRVASRADPWTGKPPYDNSAKMAAKENKLNIQRATVARNKIVAFIDSLLELPGADASGSSDPLEWVLGVLDRFHAVARQLEERGRERQAVEMNDEYDVQYVLGALLAAHFDDVRDEEWTPSYAGNSSRMDFLLKGERIVVEAKFAKKSHADKAIADELIIDKERYKAHQDCDVLVCFVHNPTHALKNPAALETDLAQQTGPKCVVVVRPR